MAGVFYFDCECGYKLVGIWGPDSNPEPGVYYRTCWCNKCHNYIVAKTKPHYPEEYLSEREKALRKIEAMAILGDNETKAISVNMHHLFCLECGNPKLKEIDLFRSVENINYNDESKLDCPACGRKLIYKRFGVS